MMVSALPLPAAPARDGVAGAPDVGWRGDRGGLLATGALAAVLVTLSLLRWHHHWAGALDLGLFDQGVWRLSRLEAPELTILPENLFGDHLSPVLLLYAPLYRIAPTPAWLLVTQALAVAATVLPARVLARDLGAPTWIATVAVAASAPLLMATLYDFHPVTMTAPLVTAALVTGRRGDVRTTVLLTVAVGLVRADSAVLMLGVAVVSTPRVRRWLVPTALASMAAGLVVPVLLDSEQTFERYYGTLGTDPVDALRHPWRVLTTLGGAQARETALLWLVPVGFLPVLRPRWLLALAVGGLPVLLSSHPNTALPWFHHAGTVAPLAIGGALAAVGASRWSSIPRAALGLGLVTALVVQGPLHPDGPRSQTLGLLRPRPVTGLATALDEVAPDDRVGADPWIVVEVARRPTVVPLRCSTFPDDCGIAERPGERLDVVVAERGRSPVLERLGWEVEVVPGGDLVVARPPQRP